MKRQLISIALACSLAACFESSTPEELIAQAQKNVSQGEVDEAVIQLKNAISRAPENTQARFLLGRIYFNQGSFLFAEKELSKAYQTINQNPQAALLHAKSLFYTESYTEAEKLFSKIEEADNQLDIGEINYYRFLISRQNRSDQASKQYIAQGLQNSSSTYQPLFRVHQLVAEQKVSDAQNEIANAKTKLSKNIEYLKLAAYVANLNQDTQKAADAYQALFELIPNYPQAFILYADALVRNQDFDKAEKQVDKLLKAYPNHSYSNTLKAVILFEKEDYQQAKQFAEVALSRGSKNPQTLVVAAVSNFKLEKFEQSYENFKNLSAVSRLTPELQRMYTAVQLKMGYDDEAVSALLGKDSVSEQDLPFFLSVTSQALRNGQYSAAQKMSDKFKSLNPDNPQSMAQLGLLDFLTRQDTQKLEDAEKMSDNASIRAALAKALYTKGDFKKLSELAAEWLVDEPDNMIALNMAALSAFSLQKTAEAEQYLDKIKTQDPENPLYLVYTAFNEIKNGETKSATQRLNLLLDKYPDSLGSYNYFVSGYAAMGQLDQAVEVLKRKYQAQPDSGIVYFAYLRSLMLNGKSTDALELLAKSKAEFKQSELYWSSLVEAYINTSQFDKAQSSLQDWVKQMPNQRQAHSRLISFYEVSGKPNDALGALQNAFHRFPDDVGFKIKQIELLISINQSLQASNEIEALEKVSDTEAIGLLKSKLALAKADYSDALRLALDSYNKSSNPGLAVESVYRAYSGLEQDDKGYQFLKQHYLSEKSFSNKMARVFAAQAIQHDPDIATSVYKYLALKNNRDVTSLNNAAWLLNQQGRTDEALKFALQAKELTESKNANVLDTLATIYMSQKNYQKAKETAAQAFHLEPENEQIALAYIATLEKFPKADLVDVLGELYKLDSNKVRQKVQSLAKARGIELR